jgi:hypothetical protein
VLRGLRAVEELLGARLSRRSRPSRVSLRWLDRVSIISLDILQYLRTSFWKENNNRYMPSVNRFGYEDSSKSEGRRESFLAGAFCRMGNALT